ncbi:hypothetical protein [Membranihabitans marinus]|uniref:hypothetical protein n=1 Tax=Membranihabitans marinus TaxID=1227546 RepID=UPI001F45AC46|nr:hypothetical protein [Membranihabitans marinus]
MRYFYTILAILVAVVIGSSQEVKVGAAKRIITPSPLLPVSGGVGIPKPAHKKEGDLFVRVMVVEKGGERLAIVGIDNLGWPSLLADETRKLVPEIPAQNIIIGSSHTHSAPDAYGFPDETGKSSADPEYLSFCIQQMAEAIKEALANTRPAVLKVNVGEAKGKIAFNYYADELYDPRCGVIQAIDAKSNDVIATLVNYAIHPEVIGNSRGILSPDLCGPLYDRIEERVGGVAVFMNGAQGGMVTADNRRPGMHEVQTYAECKRIGYILADEALRIVGESEVLKDPQVFVQAKQVTFPVTSPLMKQLMTLVNFGEEKDGNYFVKTQMNLINIGTAQIVTIPGEALPNIGYYLKRKMKSNQPFVFGLTNDAFGYILTKEDFQSFKRYDYVSRTSLGEMTGDVLVNEALELIKNNPAADDFKQ